MAVNSHQEQAADRLAAMLVARTAPVLAQSQPPAPLDAVEVEDVDVISALSRLGHALPEFCRRAILDEIDAVQWRRMTVILLQAADLCRHQAGEG